MMGRYLLRYVLVPLVASILATTTWIVLGLLSPFFGIPVGFVVVLYIWLPAPVTWIAYGVAIALRRSRPFVDAWIAGTILSVPIAGILLAVGYSPIDFTYS